MNAGTGHSTSCDKLFKRPIEDELDENACIGFARCTWSGDIERHNAVRLDEGPELPGRLDDALCHAKMKHWLAELQRQLPGQLHLSGQRRIA